MSMLDFAIRATTEYIDHMPKSQRKNMASSLQAKKLLFLWLGYLKFLMPDVVLYSEEKNWLYFIESVTSVGPMEPKRIKEIEELTTGVTARKIYVTAFLDFKTFKKFSEMLAWETEVWIADMPDHMIHLNGDKFLGPR